ncbi:MAG: hypothetical protein JNL08_01055 [Planctomycetes bacterium]|nr:hypothetical protein [Planctomycetota bacterium]
MLAPAPELEPAAGPATRLPAAPAGTWRRAWLAAAVGFAGAEAASTLHRLHTIGGHDLVWLAVALAVAIGLGLAFAPRAMHRFAAIEALALGCVGAAVLAGGLRCDLGRIAGVAAALALLVTADAAAGGRARPWWWALGGVLALVAAAAWEPVRAATGQIGAAAVAVALPLVALARGGAAAGAGIARAVRARELLLALVCLPLSWWTTRHAGAAGGAVLLLAALLGAVAAAITVRQVALAAGLATAAAVVVALPGGAAADTASVTVLVRAGDRSVVYDRATQALALRLGGGTVDRAGPDHAGSELAAVIARTFAAPGDRALVLGVGTLRLPRLLLHCGWHEVDVVDGFGLPPAWAARLDADGPVPLPTAVAAAAEPRLRCTVAPWLQALAAIPDAARQVVFVAASPQPATAPQTTIELQRELRRVAGDGLVVQAFALDLVGTEALRALLGSAAVAHGANEVFVVGDDVLLVSGTRPLAWPGADPFAGWCDDARWLAHRAHLGGLDDVRRARSGAVGPAAAAWARSELDAPVGGGERGRRAALDVLRELLLPDAEPVAPDAGSLLLRWLGQRADLRLAQTELAGLGDAADAAQRAQAVAARFLPVGAPAASLQAALGLAAADGEPLVDPALACRRAHAIDPTFWADPLPVLRDRLPRPRAPRGDLEDLACLPPGERLAELCVGEAPLAIALRARFGSACARALVAELGRGPLPPAAAEALRQLADPFVLAEAARVLAARDGSAELLAYWRRDLPLSPAIAALLRHGAPALRPRFAEALAGRTDAASLQALAECLTADALELREAAARALRVTAGDGIAYDPAGPRSALIEAADRVRALHNRAP